MRAPRGYDGCCYRFGRRTRLVDDVDVMGEWDDGGHATMRGYVGWDDAVGDGDGVRTPSRGSQWDFVVFRWR